jgi:hypothetical protein
MTFGQADGRRPAGCIGVDCLFWLLILYNVYNINKILYSKCSERSEHKKIKINYFWLALRAIGFA